MGIPRPFLLLLYEGFNIAFDHFLYPAVEFWFGSMLGPPGIAVGWAVMAAIAILQCAGFYFLFKRWGIDLAGVGYIEDVSKKTKKNWVEHLLAKLLARLDKRDPRTFLLLILNVDPYLIAIYYERDRFKGTKECDWLMFGLVVVTANLWWGFRSAILVSTFLWIMTLWNQVPHSALVLLGICVLSIFYAPPNPFLVSKEEKEKGKFKDF